MTFNINDTQHNVERDNLLIIMLNVSIVSVITLNFITMIVVMLNVCLLGHSPGIFLQGFQGSSEKPLVKFLTLVVSQLQKCLHL
jgi:hypothetical protein